MIRAVREIESVEHRLKPILNGKMTIIDDSYNSNPISFKSALDTLLEFEGNKIVVTPRIDRIG